MTWIQERKITQGPYEILIDLNEKTEERRIGVYMGETLLALDFVEPLSSAVNRVLSKAVRRPGFYVPRDDQQSQNGAPK